MTTFRNNYVGMSLGRLDKLHMHRPNGNDVLFNDRLNRTSTFRDITPQSTNESDIVGCIDKDLDIHLLEQTRFGKYQNPFDDDDRLRLNCTRFDQTSVGFEIVKGQLERFTSL